MIINTEVRYGPICWIISNQKFIVITCFSLPRLSPLKIRPIISTICDNSRWAIGWQIAIGITHLLVTFPILLPNYLLLMIQCSLLITCYFGYLLLRSPYPAPAPITKAAHMLSRYLFTYAPLFFQPLHIDILCHIVHVRQELFTAAIKCSSRMWSDLPTAYS